MNNDIVKLWVAIVLGLFLIACSSENVSDEMEPDEIIILREIELFLSPHTAQIPELSPIQFSIKGYFNNKTSRFLTEQEIEENIKWKMETSNDIKMIADSMIGSKFHWEGSGFVKIVASYQANETSGKETLNDEAEIEVTVPLVTNINVTLVDNYRVGCPLSSLSANMLAEGCLVQYEAIGTYDNGTTADLSNDPGLIWSVSDNSVAMTVDSTDVIASMIEADWEDSILQFILEEGLEGKNGLFLGTNSGNTRFNVDYRGIEYHSNPISVVPPSVKQIEITPYPESEDEISDLTDYYGVIENTVARFKSSGTFENNTVQDITKAVIWTSENNTNLIIGERTGVATAISETTVPINLNVSYGSILETVKITVLAEKLLSISYSPDELLLDCAYNMTMSFKLDGEYNNDGLQLDEVRQNQRNINLNKTTVWNTSDSSIAKIDDSDLDSTGMVSVVTMEKDGTADITAYHEALGETITWRLMVDNSSQTPVSISVLPKNHTEMVGVPVQYSVIGINSNNTSRVIPHDEINWSTDPAICEINGLEKTCISNTGIVRAYEDITTITATVGGALTDTTSLSVTPSLLKSVVVVPFSKTIPMNRSLQFNAIGVFSNRYTKLLDSNAVEWSVDDPSASINENSGVLFTLKAPASVNVTATSKTHSYANGLNVESGITGTTSVTISSLPLISISGVTSVVEGDGSVHSITVTADPPPQKGMDIEIPYAIGGSASPNDHSLVSGLVTIASGQTSATIDFLVSDDHLYEKAETVKVTIESGKLVNGFISDDISHTITINSDDPQPILEFKVPSDSRREDAGLVSTNLILDQSSDVDVHVFLSTLGSAEEDDYALKTSPIIIPSGTTEIPLDIAIINDLRKEEDETLILAIDSNASVEASIGGQSTYSLTVVDDDFLSIEDIPDMTISKGVDFHYTPTVHGVGEMTYTIINRPHWLDFAGGTLVGSVPDATSDNQGIYVCVTDGLTKNCSPPFMISVQE